MREKHQREGYESHLKILPASPTLQTLTEAWTVPLGSLSYRPPKRRAPKGWRPWQGRFAVPSRTLHALPVVDIQYISKELLAFLEDELWGQKVGTIIPDKIVRAPLQLEGHRALSSSLLGVGWGAVFVFLFFKLRFCMINQRDDTGGTRAWILM